jgi:hypothetical protein
LVTLNSVKWTWTGSHFSSNHNARKALVTALGHYCKEALSYVMPVLRISLAHCTTISVWEPIWRKCPQLKWNFTSPKKPNLTKLHDANIRKIFKRFKLSERASIFHEFWSEEFHLNSKFLRLVSNKITSTR